MEKEYNLINPAAIDERYFEAIALSKCDGCGLEDPNGNVLHRTYSALLLAVFARREGELEGAFWTLGGGNLPSDKFIAAHKRGYKDGYDLFLLRAEADKAANTIDWLKDVYQEGRKAKRKCATPLPLSVKSIQQNGYYTGMAVAASVILHRETTLFERAFGKPLVCGTAHPDVFEVTEPLGGEPLISIMDADTGTRIFDLSGKTPVDRERQSIQMHCFIGNQKRAFAEAREHLVSEAERYNRTDAIVRGYPVNEKAFAEHTLQNNYEVTIRMELLPGNKVKLNLDESLHIPPYIGVGQAIKYHGYSAKQAEAAKKEFLQNSTATEAKTQKRKPPPTVRQFAFQFLYFVGAGVEVFPKNGKNKRLLNRGIELGYKSGDDFKNTYYGIESSKLCSGDIPDLEAAIPLLDQYPEAKQLAEDRLKILKSKTV